MPGQLTPNEDLARRTVEKFWETFPVVWHNVRDYVHNTASEKQLTVGWFTILRGIHRGRDTVSQLAEMGRLSRPAISRSVDALVTRGLVSRSRDSGDRRHIKLALTEQGERLLTSVREETRHWMTDQLKALDEQELEAILRSFELLQATFAP
jgi:DNA-binding MarR family transcriptional regulator